MARKKKNPRYDELVACCSRLDQSVIPLLLPVILEMCFLEKRLTELKEMPQISVHPKNPAMQRQTAAAKQYKEMLQQYTNCVKIMLKAVGADTVEEESPLRSFMRQLMDGENNGKNQGN